jgi:hypothetical protein
MQNIPAQLTRGKRKIRRTTRTTKSNQNESRLYNTLNAVSNYDNIIEVVNQKKK